MKRHRQNPIQPPHHSAKWIIPATEDEYLVRGTKIVNILSSV